MSPWGDEGREEKGREGNGGKEKEGREGTVGTASRETGTGDKGIHLASALFPQMKRGKLHRDTHFPAAASLCFH